MDEEIKRQEKNDVKCSFSAHEANFVLCISFAAYILFALLVRSIPIFSKHALLSLIVNEITIVLPAVIFLLVKGIDRKDELELHEPEGFCLRMAFTVIVCAYPVVLIINLCTMRYVHNVVTDVMGTVTGYGLWPVMFAMAFLPAVCEEFVFRGVLYHAYRRYSIPVGIVVSSAAFGLMHMTLSQLPYAIFFGIILSIMAEVSGSVLTSMFMHFMFNGTTVALNFYSQGVQDTSAADSGITTADMINSMFDAEGILIMLLVLIICLSLITVLVRRTMKQTGRHLLIGQEHGQAVHIFDIFLLLFAGGCLYFLFL